MCSKDTYPLHEERMNSTRDIRLKETTLKRFTIRKRVSGSTV